MGNSSRQSTIQLSSRIRELLNALKTHPPYRNSLKDSYEITIIRILEIVRAFDLAFLSIKQEEDNAFQKAARVFRGNLTPCTMTVYKNLAKLFQDMHKLDLLFSHTEEDYNTLRIIIGEFDGICGQ